MYTLFVKISAGHYKRVGVVYSKDILNDILEFNDFTVEFKPI